MKHKIRDGFNFAGKLSPRRAWNATQLLTSYFASRVSGNPSHRGMPFSVSVEPTTSCNLRCPECPSGLRSFTRPTGMLSQGLFESAISELAPSLAYLIFYFQGEPYLNPSFLDMVHFASTKRIYTATSTNGHFLNEEAARRTVDSGLDRLIISLDGTTQETYASYRIGGQLERVIEGTRNILHWKKKLASSTPHVIFQFLVVKPNEHQVEEVKMLARTLGVNEVVFKTAQIYDYRNGSDLIPSIDHYSRYRKNNNGTYSIKNQLLDHCWKMWHSCVITWDGKVVPCCFDKDGHFALGDLTRNSFEEIWRSKKYTEFRASILRSRSEIEMCRNCTEGTSVWA